MYNKQPFRKSTTLSCSVSWLVGEIVIVLFWGFLPILGLFWETDWLFQQDVQAWISLCALLYFSSFWPWKLVALNVTGQCHHRQLPRPMRAKPHLPDARFMPIRTASICVYACVYIDIYIKREKYLWIYFFFPILWWELLIRNKQKKIFLGGTLPCYSEGKCLFSWK